MTRLLRLVLLATLTGSLLVTPGTASAIPVMACGTVINAAGAYELVQNLSCPAGIAITIGADFVTLDLFGFRISGQTTGDIGIDVVEGSDDVFIRGPGTIRGFDKGIQGGHCDAVMSPITDTNNLIIESVTVRNSGTIGIELCTALGDTEVRFSAVIGATTGIETAGGIFGSGGIVSVTQTLVRDTTIGILLGPINFGESYVTGSFVDDAFGTGIGISLGGVGGGATTIAEVSDSTIRGCDNCLRGITVLGAGDVLIARNSIRDWDEVAISVVDVPSVTIEDNFIRTIGGGMFFVGAIVFRNQDANTGALVSTTLVRDISGGPGIHLICTQGVAVEDSVVLNADGDGILIDDAAPAGSPCPAGVVSQADVLRHNLILGAGGNGVAIASGYGYTLTENVALASAVDGFNIASALVGCCGVEGAYLTDNVGRGSGDDGFQLDTASLELTTNTARNNTGFGFETNFVGPVDVDNGQTTVNNTAGNCSDPSDLPNTLC